MIEISQTRGRRDEKNKIKKQKKTPKLHSSMNKTFAAELNETMANRIEGTVDELLDVLKEQEKRFLQHQTEAELLNYKALIQKILKMILGEGFREKTLKRTKKNWGDFVIIEKINNRLLDITKAITESNKAFNLLKTVEEIRGLILDLLS